MAFALYYRAKRKEPLTEQERAAVKEITQRYCAGYPLRRRAEDFGVYDGAEEADVIFSGATRLPGAGLKTLYNAANYWLKCLTEITRLLKGARWDATLDDVALILDPAEGWRLPTDEEYRQQFPGG